MKYMLLKEKLPSTSHKCFMKNRTQYKKKHSENEIGPNLKKKDISSQ